MAKFKKKKSNKNSKNEPIKLSKKRLLRTEYDQYRLIGEIDRSQNWLELFTPTVISDLFTILHSCSDNQLKSDYIRKELAYYGFEPVGLGTNVYTMANPAYPGVIYKFALDDNGLADNFNDALLCELVNEYLVEECGDRPRYTRVLARHPSAIVSVQERKVVVANQDRMDTFRGSVLRVLEELSKKFMIIDLSPSHYHLNYGIDRDGEWCFVDASDLYPLANVKKKVRCEKAIGWNDKKKVVKRCGGRLRYNKDFSAIICENCGSEFLPLEIRPKDKEDKDKMASSILDGMTREEREEMRLEEMRRVLGDKMPTTMTVVNDSDEDDEVTSRKIGEKEVDDKPLPTKSNPQMIFVPPAPESVEEDEPETVELPTIQEPKTFFESLGKKDPEPELDDTDEEEDDDDDDSVVVNAYPRSETPMVPAVSDDEDDDDTEEEDETSGETNEVQPKITYSVVNWEPNQDPSVDNSFAGIFMKIEGDFEKAFEEYGLGLYIQLEGSSTTSLAISADTFRKILSGIVADLIEEENAFRAYQNRE